MGNVVRVLIIEDNVDDAELVLLELRRGGYEPRSARVDSLGALKEALSSLAWDIVISDFQLPGMNAIDALAMVRDQAGDIPFIVVSGAIGEEVAAELMKAGAQDFIGKNHLKRMVSALEREIREASVRRARQEAESVLKRTSEKIAFLAEAGKILGESIERELPIKKIAELIVRDGVDWCCIDVRNQEGVWRRAAVAHASLSKAPLCAQLETGHEPRFEIPNAKPEAFALEDFWNSTVSQNLRDDEKQAKIIGELGAQYAMIVPLVTRRQVYGLIGMFRGPAGSPFNGTDLYFAEELGARLGSALENFLLYEQARHAVGLREDILAIVSHDLKNPLSSIVMSAAVIERVAQGYEREQLVRKQIEVIQRSSRRMERLISDLLDFAKIQGGRMVLERKKHPAAGLLAEAVEMFEPIASERGIKVMSDASDDGSQVYCDHDRILQVLSNLIGNAIKFTPDGTTVTVRLEGLDSNALFSVSDMGPGISSDDLPHVFEKYWQSRRTAHKGSGLGLSIARGLVEAHGGKVWVESSPGNGATFRFTLPATHESARDVA